MLRVSDLTGKELDRARQNHETYKELYDNCVKHIRRRNEMGQTTTRYHVPGFVVGRPLFNHAHAVRYIREKLERGKFDVETVGTGEIMIDWTTQKRHVIRKKAPKQAVKKDKEDIPRALRDGVGGSKKKIAEPLHVRLARLNHELKMAR